MADFKFAINPKPKSENDFLIIRPSEHKIRMSIRVYKIKDHNHFIQYIPSLNLSGYGDSEGDALEMLKEVVKDYCENLVDLRPELQEAELSKYGFKRERWKRKQFTSRVHVDKKGILQNFELPEDTPIEEASILV